MKYKTNIQTFKKENQHAKKLVLVKKRVIKILGFWEV